MLFSLMVGPGFGFGLGKAWKYDIFFVDSLSTCIPIIRALTGKRVVFYCHFPDKVLSMGTYEDGGHRKEGAIKRLYRAPVDLLEEFTTGECCPSMYRFSVFFQILLTTFLTVVRCDCAFALA